ncbi:hypothetical protein MHYP_G00227120 [Metynnis hypsauchen]
MEKFILRGTNRSVKSTRRDGPLASHQPLVGPLKGRRARFSRPQNSKEKGASGAALQKRSWGARTSSYKAVTGRAARCRSLWARKAFMRATKEDALELGTSMHGGNSSFGILTGCRFASGSAF